MNKLIKLTTDDGDNIICQGREFGEYRKTGQWNLFTKCGWSY
jgi:hypothetical protein